MELRQKVRELRRKKGWNQSTLAAQAGLTQATLSRIENGKVAQPKMTHLRRLAASLGVSMDYLAGDTIQLSLDDLLKDQDAQIVFRGWVNLDSAQKRQLSNLVRFFEQEADKEGSQEE